MLAAYIFVFITEHDAAEEVTVKVFACQENNLNVLTHLKFTYISQMEHAIAKFLAQSVSDAEVAEKLDAVWTVCLGKDHLELWDKRLAQAFAQLELPIEWTLVGDILQKGIALLPYLPADLTVRKRPETSYQIEIHFTIFTHLSLLFS